jgi:hypothetical protein
MGPHRLNNRYIVLDGRCAGGCPCGRRGELAIGPGVYGAGQFHFAAVRADVDRLWKNHER